MDYVNSFTDSRGKLRHVFRRKGFRKVTIKGQPGSPEFMEAYEDAMEALPASSSPGVVVARRGLDSKVEWQPLIGVYLLMLNGMIVYIGSSLKMPTRVAVHRRKGLILFDQAFYIATTADQREWLEDTLIMAIKPPQNKIVRLNH
jgi:hypothetical protein